MKRIQLINSGKEIKNEEQTKITHKNYRNNINNRKNNKKKIKTLEKRHITNQNGITLLVLSITIIVLLILAGITISAITGDNGIIGNAGQAKEETEIANEKEILEKATIQVMGNNKSGNIEERELQEQLDKETGEEKTEVSDVGDEFEVLFNESNRYYTVDKQGNVEGAYEFIEDKYPGDITIGINGEELNGNSKEEGGKPYEIWCIEDLVAFSNIVDGNGIKFEDGESVQVTAGNRNGFSGKYVVLKTNLNFKSKLSYADSERTDFGDINGNANDGNALMNEMTTGEGFKPIGFTNTFVGNFNGENNDIKEIYIKRPDSSVGLFGQIGSYDAEIKIQNINISGNMIGSTGGGIVGTAHAVSFSENVIKIENCVSNVNIETTSYSGGIIGERSSGDSNRKVIVTNCINNGTIKGVCIGGIIGSSYVTSQIINCCNNGKILQTENGSDAGGGGIVGRSMFAINIINSYNYGDIEAIGNAGGILGYSYWAEKSIENCYNIGKVSGSTAGGILGGLNISNELLVTQNCFYLNSNISKGIGGWDSSKESLEDIQGLTDAEIKSTEILENLNNYVAENKTIEGITLKTWIKGENGYPVLDNN